MMKLLNLLFTIFCVSSLIAQEPVYTWGKPQTNENPERGTDKLISLGDKGFVLLRQSRSASESSNYWLEYYDPSLTLISNIKIEFSVGVMGDSYDIEKIVPQKGVLYALVSHWDKTTMLNTLSLKTVNLNGRLDHYMNLTSQSAEKYMNRGGFDVTFSENGKKLLVINEAPFERKTFEKLSLTCFDVETKKEDWTHAQELKTPSDRGYNNNIAISNSGKAIMFKKYSEKMKWYYALFTCGGPGDWNENSLSILGERVISDYKITTNNDNEFILYALLADKVSKYDSQVESLMTVKISTDLENIDVKEIPFPLDLVSKIEGGNGKKTVLRNVTMKEILYRKDGRALVLLEKITSKKDGVPGTQPVQYRYEWNYNDFIAMCINDNDQSLAWFQSFKKDQKTINNEEEDNYGSVIYHLKNDRLYVFWNNTELSVPSIPPASWKEPDGTKYVKKDAFNEKTMYATFMQIMESDGSMVYKNRTHGLPLLNLHKGNVFEMSLTTRFFFDYQGDLVVMSSMNNQGLRYQFGIIGF